MNRRIAKFLQNALFLIGGIAGGGNAMAVSTHVLQNNMWSMISLPADPGSSASVETIFGDDLPISSYGVTGTWVIFAYNPTTNSYTEVPTNSSLQAATGYWMLQMTGIDVTIDLPASATAFAGVASTACPSSDGCVSVAVASAAGTNQWNLLGFPADSASSFGQTRFATQGGACASGCTPDQAEASNIINNVMFHYTGSAYVEITSASNMQPWDGVWVAALPGANGLSPRWLHPVAAPAEASDSEIDAARLLAQATFGPSISTIEEVIDIGGPEAWIDDQLSKPIGYHLPVLQNNGGGAGRTARYDAFWQQALYADDQLRQRVAFALSEILVVSDVPDVFAYHSTLLTSYYDLLMQHGLGNYRDLLKAVTLSPAMGIFLSMMGNEKPDAATGQRADENYAREIMQLFSIGLEQLNNNGTVRTGSNGQPLPTYQQTDVENLARTLTGWSWDLPTWRPVYYPSVSQEEGHMIAFPAHHDTDSKQFLNTPVPAGQTPEQDLNIALDTLFAHPNVGPFIAKQLIQRLVTSNPSPAYVGRIASVFNENIQGEGERGNLGAVVKAILMDREARDADIAADNHYGKLREPLLRFSHLLRAFEVQDRVRVRAGYYVAPHAPLTANSVFNFFSPSFSPAGPIKDAGLVAPEFQINSESRINRLNKAMLSVVQHDNYFTFSSTVLNLTTERALFATPQRLIDHLNLLLMSGSMSDNLQQLLLRYMAENKNLANPDDERILRDVIFLVITSAEYSVQQ